jgi:hypothetical protein
MQTVYKKKVRRQVAWTLAEEIIARKRYDLGRRWKNAIDFGPRINARGRAARERQAPSMAHPNFEIMGGTKLAMEALENIEIRQRPADHFLQVGAALAVPCIERNCPSIRCHT